MIKEYIQNKLNNRKDMSILMVITIGFLLGTFITLNAFDLNNIIENKNIILAVVCLIIMLIKRKELEEELSIREKKRFLFFNILWLTLLITILISKIIHKELNIIDDLIFMTIVPIFFFYNNSYKQDENIQIASFLNIFPLICIMKPVNSIAIIISFIGVMILNLTMNDIKKNGKIITYVIIVAIISVLIMLTRCRTALITFAIIAIINYISIVVNCKNDENVRRKNKYFLIILFVLSPIILFTLKNYIFNKYESTSTNLTSGRTKMWKIILEEDVGAFGLGNQKLINDINKGDSHNIFFQTLGHYGIIPTILFVFVNAYLIYRCIKKKNFEIINLCLCYYLIGMFENILIFDTRIIMCNFIFFYLVGKLLKD